MTEQELSEFAFLEWFFIHAINEVVKEDYIYKIVAKKYKEHTGKDIPEKFLNLV